MSAAHLGKTRTEETRRKLSAALKGKPLSEETKRKISEAGRGKIPWNKGKPSPMKGKTLNEEHRQKISAALKGKPGRPPWNKGLKSLAVLLLIASPLRAQVVQVTGGSSTLFNASGGGATLYLRGSETEVGAGLVNGHLGLDFAERFNHPGWQTTVGDSFFNATVGQTGLSQSVRGVTLSREDVTVFAGLTGTTFATPFFQTARASHGSAGFYYHPHLKLKTQGPPPRGAGSVGPGGTWQATLLGVSSGTALADVSWQHGDFSLGGGGGLLAKHTLAQARAQYHWNGHLTLSSNFLRYRGSTLATVMGAFGLGPLSIYATELGGTRSGQVFGGNLRPLGWLDVGANYLRYKGSANLTLNTGQRLGRRIIVREFAARDGMGRWNISVGGGFNTNRFSIDINRQSFITPLGKAPIQQSLVINVRVTLPWRSITINSASGLLPDGRWRWGAYGGTFIGSGLGSPDHAGSYHSSGKYLITGQVVDKKGQPVSGAALKIGKDMTFSDSSGRFFLRVKRKHAVALAVLPGEFTGPGHWRAVIAPGDAAPGDPIVITVEKE